ncbi:MAG: tryptophan synthase subunit alpha, partial [Flavobacteriales bacterium]|nr:tryptophan synthase subunit alpha [Flavobacteriales bacterium]
GDNWEINKQTAYFEQVRDMHLKNPTMVGFGISSKDKLLAACSYANGGIIGSAFIRAIENSSNLEQTINQFIQKFKQ